MKWKQLKEDDSGVSPVIGVILMVAITVILAAVIATFVLGLGEQVSESTPNINVEGDWANSDEFDGSDDSDTILTITHTNGPTIESDRLELRGGGVTDEVQIDTSAGIDPSTETYSAGDSIVVSGTEDADLSAGDEIRLVWQNDDGDSAVLQTFTAPDDYTGANV